MKHIDSAAPVVQAANYGIGAFFPVVVLDGRRRWQQPGPGMLPTPDEESEQVLALRWTGTAADLDAGIDLLRRAAHDAPTELTPDRLARYADSLPASLRIITLPARALLGPWVDGFPGVPS